VGGRSLTAYVMSQMGHTRAALALEGYAKKMARRRNTGARMDALIKPAGWCEKGAKRRTVTKALRRLRRGKPEVAY
jgi:hypothetical protein